MKNVFHKCHLSVIHDVKYTWKAVVQVYIQQVEWLIKNKLVNLCSIRSKYHHLLIWKVPGYNIIILYHVQTALI